MKLVYTFWLLLFGSILAFAVESAGSTSTDERYGVPTPGVSSSVSTPFGVINYSAYGGSLSVAGMTFFEPWDSGYNVFQDISADVQQYGRQIGYGASESVLNAGNIRSSLQEVTRPDFTTPWGWAAFGIGVVSLTANTIDAAANVVSMGIKPAVTGAIKRGFKEAAEIGAKEGTQFGGVTAEKQLFSEIGGQGMDPTLFARMKAAFERQGGVMKVDAESTRLAQTLGVEGITFDAKTIALPQNPSTSAVYEELIHTAQLRRGMTDVTQMEIEAAEKLIRFRRGYRIPNAETRQTIGRLRQLRGAQ